MQFGDWDDSIESNHRISEVLNMMTSIRLLLFLAFLVHIDVTTEEKMHHASEANC